MTEQEKTNLRIKAAKAIGMNRPDYVKCVLIGYHGDRTTFCGRKPDVFEWLFQDASHAVLTARGQDRILICPDCAAEITRLILSQTYEVNEVLQAESALTIHRTYEVKEMKDKDGNPLDHAEVSTDQENWQRVSVPCTLPAGTFVRVPEGEAEQQ